MMSTRAYLRKKYREMRSQHPELLDDAIRVTSKFHVIEEKVATVPPNIEMVDLDEDNREVLEQMILDDDMVLTTEQQHMSTDILSQLHWSELNSSDG